jgi:hypothetical protein
MVERFGVLLSIGKRVESFRSSSLFQRRRDFERERELDTKDRQKELAEIDELKRQIMAEGGIENADEEAWKRHRAQVRDKIWDREENDS